MALDEGGGGSGMGLGTASPGVRYVVDSRGAESMLIYLLWELGIVGFVGYVWLIGAMIQTSYRAGSRRPVPRERLLWPVCCVPSAASPYAHRVQRGQP